ncbi:unnamed protein product [Parascedosporium putredinis]|uniref:Uncharacterized protein n=1 Tax=Parascedosporium putredinis TaxID=1442378 RepID=A0A9P1MDG7_9PEZI|nr:unnamed protein product [Parascedosporium putredinis]CAI8000554.1 unnamed protein product [Parascedosporium putredinis]
MRLLALQLKKTKKKVPSLESQRREAHSERAAIEDYQSLAKEEEVKKDKDKTTLRTMNRQPTTRNRLWPALLRLVLLLGLATWTIEARSLAPRQEDDVPAADTAGRERVSINQGWRFRRFTENPDSLGYSTMKPWIMPAANNFVKDAARHAQRPANPPSNVEFAQSSFDDGAWDSLNLPTTGPSTSPSTRVTMSPLEAAWGASPFTASVGTGARLT